MTPLIIDTHMMALEQLLDSIERGELAIPDFQRSFLWSDQQVVSLLATVLNGWPAGSLLLMRGGAGMFRLRELEPAGPLTSVRTTVLDGQQRLTALYSAFRNAGPTVVRPRYR
jgi:uncharacterized protein with ParB-like and HNH nuclease domain